ncbi:hypothetical protein L6452_23645 [Arctium lappa]|uniref:Uncharacterized protein n=1 Tax=Arctium lappa TaxID=4217 RepID=A0ACB9B1H4_ARCLA|nr:hypothetical protein L6452_23645 [Arctium lappa]
MSYQPRSSNHNENDDDHRHNRRLYNPYQDLGVPVQTLYKLPTSPEYLFQEESVAQRRSWGENLTYYTGIGYLGGAVVGAGKGLVEGVKASEAGDTMKLKVNRILNASGHAGRKIGNRSGVIGLLYAGMESGMVAVRDTDDIVNSVVAGLGTGAVYKAAAGPRSAAVAGAIGGIAVGLAVTGKQVLKRYSFALHVRIALDKGLSKEFELHRELWVGHFQGILLVDNGILVTVDYSELVWLV